MENPNPQLVQPRAPEHEFLRTECRNALRWLSRPAILITVLLWRAAFWYLFPLQLRLSYFFINTTRNDNLVGEITWTLIVSLNELLNPVLVALLLAQFSMIRNVTLRFFRPEKWPDIALGRLDPSDLWPALLARPILFAFACIASATLFDWAGRLAAGFEVGLLPGFVNWARTLCPDWSGDPAFHPLEENWLTALKYAVINLVPVFFHVSACTAWMTIAAGAGRSWSRLAAGFAGYDIVSSLPELLTNLLTEGELFVEETGFTAAWVSFGAHCLLLWIAVKLLRAGRLERGMRELDG